MDRVLRDLRSMTGLSQKAFGEWLHIPTRTIEEWEAGRRKPPKYVLELIEYKVRMEYCGIRVEQKGERH